MGLVKIWSLTGCLALALVATLFYGSAMAEPHIEVIVEDGPEGSVRPDLDTAAVQILFNGIQSGSAHIKLKSPKKEFFSPTDFPWVEGTELIEATLSISGGKASFHYMFPIRGEYPLTVEWSDENGTPLGSQQMVISIQENPQEIQNAILFIALLCTFGIIIGYGLARGRRNLYAAA